MNCKNCGKELQKGSDVCKYCGTYQPGAEDTIKNRAKQENREMTEAEQLASKKQEALIRVTRIQKILLYLGIAVALVVLAVLVYNRLLADPALYCVTDFDRFLSSTEENPSGILQIL